MKYLFLVILSFFMYLLEAQEQIFLRFDIKNYSFAEFVELIERETGHSIYYNQDLVKDVKVNINAGLTTVSQALEMALMGTNLRVSGWNGGFVILKDEILITRLPSFTREDPEPDSSVFGEITNSEMRYMQGRRSDVVEKLIIGDVNTPKYGKIRVTGTITDKDTGEPIIGATIYIEETKTGAASDLNGFFAIILSRGNYNAQFSSIGYEQKKFLIDIYSDGRIYIELKSVAVSLQEAVIIGDRQMDIKLKDPGLEKISLSSIKSIPMMMGERDIIKVSELLPGIVSVGEGSSGLNVRGGSSDQNAFYLNKVPIYNTSHLFGFFPAFNSDIIKDFSIYKGHIPAEYGGRLSSVFNITTRQGNKKDFIFHGGVNPMTANVTLEGPVIKEKSSVLISARSTYSDWLLSRVKDPIIKNSNAGFNDLSFYFDHHSENSVVSAFLYSSEDKFKLAELNTYNYANRGGSVNFYHRFNNLLRMNMALIASNYGFTTIDKQEVSSSFKHGYGINHYEFRNDLIQTLTGSNELKFGMSAIYYQLERGKVIPYGTGSLRNTIDLGDEQGLEAAIYLSDKIDVTSWLSIHAGFRYSQYAPLGEKKVYRYTENKPKEVIYISDSLSWGANEIIKWYRFPEFRFSVNIETDPGGSLKLAFNQTSQNLFMLNNTIAIAPNTQWKLADYHIKPSTSNQLSAGVFRNIRNREIEASAEIFYKKTRDYSEFRDGADFLNNPLIETEVLQGNLESYGAEFMLKKKSGRLNGWLAYTYSRSFVHINGDHTWEKINNGKKYPSNFDIPHAMNAVVNYSFSKRVTLATVITYQQGKPVTYPVSVYYSGSIPVIDYYERNRYRIPNYFRTDLSLTIEGNLRKNKFIHSSWMFSVYNLTGRKNAYSVYFTSEKGRINSYKYSVIGVPLATATWLFKFGNYASQ